MRERATGTKWHIVDTGEVAWMIEAPDGHRTYTKSADDDDPETLRVLATYCVRAAAPALTSDFRRGVVSDLLAR